MQNTRRWWHDAIRALTMLKKNVGRTEDTAIESPVWVGFSNIISHPLKVEQLLIYIGQVEFPGGSEIKNPPANVGLMGSRLGLEDPLQKEAATHSSILTWRISWTEEPGGYSPCGCKESDMSLLLNHHHHSKSLCDLCFLDF